MSHARLLVLASLASGCVIGSDKYPRPSELPASWLVDRPRILAVVAEPPEVRPGDTVRFSALVPDPTDTIDTVVWFMCPPEAGDGCELDEEAVIGVEPGLPPTWTAPDDALAALSEADRLEGITTQVQLAAFPAEALADTGAVDLDEVEVGFKRLVLSEATTPNQNPVAQDFTVDGIPVPSGASAEVDAGQRYELGFTIPESSVESYEYVTSEGVAEQRLEEPYATWFCTGGTLLEAWTLHPHTTADWTAPDDSEDVTCWAVVRDRRGGMAWIEQRLTIR